MMEVNPWRVLMIVHSQYQRDARVRRYAESLLGLGHEVDVIALADLAASSVPDTDGLNLISISVRRKRAGKLRSLFEWLAFSVLATWKVLNLQRRRHYQIVHIHNMPNFLVFISLPAKLSGAKVVLDIHDLVPELFSSKFATSLDHSAMKVLHMEERVSCRFADAVILATDLFREIAVARGSCSADKAVTVLNTPDLTLFDQTRFPWTGPDSSGEFRVLYVGTVAPRYGVDQAINAMKLLHSELPGLRFLIYPRLDEGEGDALTHLRELVRHLELESVVEFRHPVPLEEMPAVMASANVGIYTPRVDVHTDIALSIKVPEFVAMSVPIVTVRTQVMEQYFSADQVAYFEDGDIEACANAIRGLYGDPSRARRMADRARRFLDQHHWENERQRYFALLSRLLEAG